MQSIVSLIDLTPLFSEDLAAGSVAKAFAEHPGAALFAVAGSAGDIVGLIERSAVERAIVDGQAARAIGELMRDSPPTVDVGCTAKTAMDLLLSHPGRPDALAAIDGGAYVGLCTLRALAQALAAQAGVSHVAIGEDWQRIVLAAEAEFRSHVQGLLAMTDRLERQHLSGDALAQVHSIRAASKTLLRLADDTNDMLQARRGRLKLTLSPQPLRALMDRVQARWADRAREAGVSLLISYDGAPDLSAMVDGERLTQVFDNLIDNALRYTRHGSIEASLRARIDGGKVTLDGGVRDTGPGVGSARLAAGLDGDDVCLSLSLAQGILASMNGDIRAESNTGQGATLLFSLTAESPGEAPAAATPAEAPSRGGTPHILVVDDNATNRMVAEALCEMFDCTSETAEDGVEAVERMRDGRFDLILMDIKMPRMDGIAATRAIRALSGPQAQIPIIALTANVDPEDARSYLAAGMCCVVEKPIKPDRLLNAINLALESGRDAARSVDGGQVAAA